MRNQICAALDISYSDAIKFIDKAKGRLGWVKIGPALLTHPEGINLLQYAKDSGFKVFADYKFKDIPSVVAKGITNLIGKADLVTIHIDGGDKMIREAVTAADGKLLIIGITVLTSLNEEDLRDFNIHVDTSTQVARLAEVGSVAGIDGFVSSANELPILKKAYSDLFCVTPGLKMGDSHKDQKRTADPRWAYQQGSNLLVMGRDIYQAEDPIKQIDEIEKWCLG